MGEVVLSVGGHGHLYVGLGRGSPLDPLVGVRVP